MAEREVVGRLRARGRIGKYRIIRRIGEGGFASVYSARDTIEGINVALKVPDPAMVAGATFDALRHEVKLTAGLDHPNILPIKNAEVIDGRFVIASPLGIESLDDRISRRLSARRALLYTQQAIEAVAHAHERRIIHCDIKPENMILFPEDRLRLGDFGIARVALTRTTLASVAGTLGYMAPEQAMGRPSPRSDVFSLGLVIYRLFAGEIPRWPFDWPPAGIERARQILHPDFLAMLQRCMEVDDRKRFASGVELRNAFMKLRRRALEPHLRRSRTRTATAAAPWRSVRARQFVREHGASLEAKAACPKCSGPVSESMRFCPWCSRAQAKYDGPRRFSLRCGRCGRSAKRDWRYCAHCYGGSLQEPPTRTYPDRRYSSHCHSCRGPMMPFMAYCPHCRAKAQQRWLIGDTRQRCAGCGWGVLRDYWQHCPWCQRAVHGR